MRRGERPRWRLVLAHLEHPTLCLDPGTDAPPGDEGAGERCVRSIPSHHPTPNFPPSWNVAPTDPLPVVRFDPKAVRSLDLVR
jgi:hypothetical protein